MPEPLPEPWLRGPLPGVEPAIASILFAFQQAREDLEKHTEGLSREQIWARPHGLTPLGFHLRHIAGSVERLIAYLLGRDLSDAQMTALRNEMDPSASREELLESIHQSLDDAERVIRSTHPGAFPEPRFVGRKRLPTTVAGLAIHIAEHTQRHVGQAIGAAKLVRAFSNARL